MDYNQRPPAHHFDIIDTKGTQGLSDGATRFYRVDKKLGRVFAPGGEGAQRDVYGTNEISRCGCARYEIGLNYERIAEGGKPVLINK